MASDSSSEPVIDRTAFEAYTQLRSIAKKYNVEDELEVPQLVIVGETSTGKSMLVQNFLRFPCSFSQSDVATRCPVAYRLVYNPSLPVGQLRVVRPAGINAPQLANYLQDLMLRIQTEYTETGGFRQEPELIEIESAEYTDFEIIDLPGLVGGDKVAANRQAVERIAEHFVRNPRFSIVLVKEAAQITDNSHGARVVDEICKKPVGIDPTRPPRHDYHDHMITIHTKFDSFMLNHTNGTTANAGLAKQMKDFSSSYFTNMIFGGYSMTEKGFDDNVTYLRGLPDLEKQEIDKWVENINKISGIPPDNYQTFNTQYRSRIGIDIVRNQIQALWLKAFRAALPKLNSTLLEQLEEAKQKYNSNQERYNLLNPKALQESYLHYLDDFRSTLRQYVAYKSEIDSTFPINKTGKTYAEIEAGYNLWKRKKQVTWRAYLSTDDLRQRFPEQHKSINARLVGSSHFKRLQNLFGYMILNFKPREPTNDWIESAAAYLSSKTSDFDDMEKAVREILRTLQRETILLGISWLTQMYSYLLDVFRVDIKEYLLSDQKYPFLRDHEQFLNSVDLEYHLVVRKMQQDSIRLIRDVRTSLSAYAHYDLTARMLKLVFAIPKEIPHAKFKQPLDNIYFLDQTTGSYRAATLDDVFNSVPPEKIMGQVYGSESFLTQVRDPATDDHYAHARRVIEELYRASVGKLLDDIRSSFNTNLIMKIHSFDQIEEQTLRKRSSGRYSLFLRISRMREEEIGAMSNMCLDEINEECRKSIEKIEALTDALSCIDAAIRGMTGEQGKSALSKGSADSPGKDVLKPTDYLRKKQEHVETQHQQKQSQNLSKPTADAEDGTVGVNAHDDIDELLNIHDPALANIFLSETYDKHDREDLKYGFVDGDSLDQDKDYFLTKNQQENTKTIASDTIVSASASA